MTLLPSSDLALLRDSKSHYTDLHLSIFQPTVVFQAQVNDGSIARGEREITYDNVTTGSWSNVKIGSTLLVGSSVGARNVGKVRVKEITSSVITVAENSHIKWEDELNLTILDYFDVWPIYPRIIQDPSDAEQVIFYKDYDIAYTDQNEILGAFINIGPHRAAFDGEQLYYSASGTYPHSGTISTVEWAFDGGNPSSSSDLTPGYVTYDTPGHYLTTFVASGTNGWVETAYRYVSIYDKPANGTDIPIQKWELTELSGSRGEGGWRGSITVHEPITVEEGSVVVLFAEEWYGSTKKSLGGNAPNASQIKFVGYVMDNSIRYNYKESSVSFEIGSLSQILKEMGGFAIELQSASSPSTWYEMEDVNGKKAIYHYLKWHSNVISLADIEWIGTDNLIQYFDSDRESIFDAIDNLLRVSYKAAAVCDRQGKIYLETDAYARPDATGTFTPIFNLTKNDYLDTPNITEQRYPPASYIELGGIAYSGISTGTFKPLLSEAPGITPNYRGEPSRNTSLAILGQSQLNQLVGNVFTHENAQYPNIDFQFRGNYSNLDIAPQEGIQVDIAADDTARGEAISGLYTPTNLIWSFDPENKVLMVRGTTNVITSGEAGQTITIPEVVDDGGYGGRKGGGISIPSIPIPSIPVAASVYGALKLDSTQNVSLVSSQIKEVPLTDIEFSSEGIPAGTASGTFSGANIIPAVGVSGTSIPFNYGFLTTYPGIYRITGAIDVVRTVPTAITFIELELIVNSNSIYQGVIPDVWHLVHDPSSNEVDTIHGSTILKLPANGYVYLTAVNYSSLTMVLDRAVASLEFLAYG